MTAALSVTVQTCAVRRQRGAYFRATGTRVLAPVPCLVQHDGIVPSVAGHRQGRSAGWVVTGSPLDIDWLEGFDNPVIDGVHGS